jgi:hypothetical protein
MHISLYQQFLCSCFLIWTFPSIFCKEPYIFVIFVLISKSWGTKWWKILCVGTQLWVAENKVRSSSKNWRLTSFTSNVQGQKAEASARPTAQGEGLEPAAKAPEHGRRRRLLQHGRRPPDDGSKGPSEGFPGGGPQNPGELPARRQHWVVGRWRAVDGGPTSKDAWRRR